MVSRSVSGWTTVGARRFSHEGGASEYVRLCMCVCVCGLVCRRPRMLCARVAWLECVCERRVPPWSVCGGTRGFGERVCKSRAVLFSAQPFPTVQSSGPLSLRGLFVALYPLITQPAICRRRHGLVLPLKHERGPHVNRDCFRPSGHGTGAATLPWLRPLPRSSRPSCIRGQAAKRSCRVTADRCAAGARLLRSNARASRACGSVRRKRCDGNDHRRTARVARRCPRNVLP